MFGFDPTTPVNTDALAHLVQTALTPVFLLSGIASLLGVFSSRLARVSDRCHQLEIAVAGASDTGKDRLERQFHRLQRRTHALDTAVLLGTAGGAFTCGAAMLLFLASLRDATLAGLLYLSFGLALLCTMGALGCFMTEVLMASRGLAERQDAAVRRMRGHAGDDAGADVEPPEDDGGHGPDVSTVAVP